MIKRVGKNNNYNNKKQVAKEGLIQSNRTEGRESEDLQQGYSIRGPFLLAHSC